MFKSLPCLLIRIFGVDVLQVAEGASDGQLCTCVCQLPLLGQKVFLVHFAITLMMLDGAFILKCSILNGSLKLLYAVFKTAYSNFNMDIDLF